MNGYLMFENRAFSVDRETDEHRRNLTVDLELEQIISAMSGGDPENGNICRSVLLTPLTDPAAIRYRQAVLSDCLRIPEMVNRLDAVCLEAEEKRRRMWCWLRSRRISASFSSALELLEIELSALKKLRDTADEYEAGVRSSGFRRLFSMLQTVFSDAFFTDVCRLTGELSPQGGTLISARFGDALQGVSYVLRKKDHRPWLFAPSFTLPEQDDAGAEDLLVRRERAIADSADFLIQSAENLSGFLAGLREELVFYLGAVRLFDRLCQINVPVCMPEIEPADSDIRSWKNLCDGSLALLENKTVIGNDRKESACRLWMITGANQGGKTTFLRSMGQAQLMAQCGMFVCAEEMKLPVRRGVFTHFPREEDGAMKQGRLDEELSRFSRMADQLCGRAVVLLNESCASADERAGSELLTEITRAFLDREIEVFSVTHLDRYARRFADREKTAFLRAERLENGERSYRIVGGLPGRSAFAGDIDRKIFGADGGSSD